MHAVRSQEFGRLPARKLMVLSTMMYRPTRFAVVTLLAGTASAQLNLEWTSTLATGTGLSNGLVATVVDAAGVTYVTGVTGPSSNRDIVTAAFGSGGTLLWSSTFDGPVAWHDQAGDITLGPGGRVFVTGSTPDPLKFANVVVLEYDGGSGALLNTIQYTSGPYTSEAGGSIVVGAQGAMFVGGGTVGDGSDVQVLKFDAAGQLAWRQTWDGPAWGPYSQDTVKQVALDPSGDLLVLVHGVMNSNQPDYVVVKYAATTGAVLWETTWGVTGGDYPREMVVDAAGDVFVTGTTLQTGEHVGTIKLRGSDGQLLWQAVDVAGAEDRPAGLALDGAGDVYVTASSDSDGNLSNNNNDFFTVKRDSQTGALAWTHFYGDPCKNCADNPTDVIVDSAGNVFVTGRTKSAPYTGDAITFVLDAATGIELSRTLVPPTTSPFPVPGFLALDGTENLYNVGGSTNATTGLSEIAVTKYTSLTLGAGASRYCVAKVNSLGCTPQISSSGFPSASQAQAFDVRVDLVRNQKPGLYLYKVGGAQANLPFQGGTLCVGPTGIRRTPVLTSGGNPTPGNDCSGAFALDFNAFAVGAAGGNPDPGLAVPGNTYRTQAWGRDQGFPAPNNTTLSDALEVTIGG
jgi:hypothetical protein